MSQLGSHILNEFFVLVDSPYSSRQSLLTGLAHVAIIDIVVAVSTVLMLGYVALDGIKPGSLGIAGRMVSWTASSGLLQDRVAVVMVGQLTLVDWRGSRQGDNQWHKRSHHVVQVPCMVKCLSVKTHPNTATA